MSLRRLTRRQVVLTLLANSALAAACGAPQGGRGVPVAFRHGVASGDPGVDSIVLWTRVTPSQPAVIDVEWELARDAEFTEVLAAGRTATAEEIDYTVKTVVEGLAPGQSYFYRFRSGDTLSPVGRTRTLPGVGVERVALAVISCSHFSFGFYNVYRDIAQRDDLDAVVHLGDYIYESSADDTGSGYGGEQGRRLGREHDPTHEAATLADYRARYAQYRSDPDLQAAHARLPFITVWDDHESANDCWMEGAEAHDPLTQGPWDVRRDASLQAYYEWLPLREPEDGRPLYEIDRRYDFGDIASLYMVDTRLTGRTRQFSYSRDLVYIHTPFDFSDPDAPRAIVDAQDLALIPAESVRHVKTPFDTRGETREPVLDYARIQQFAAEGLPPGFEYWPDTQRTREEVLADDARAILSSEQEAWLAQGIEASVEAGIAWQVLGSAVVMASMPAPDYTQVFPPELIADALADNPYTQHWLDRTRYGLPISMDAWDGYPKARERVYDMVRDSNADFIVVSGDSHNFWMNKLHDQRDGRIVATEFATTSVTSMGGYEWFGDDPRIFELAEQTMMRECEDVEFFDARHRGYLMLEMTRSQARAHYIGMDTIVSRDYTAKTLASFTLDKATDGARAPAA